MLYGFLWFDVGSWCDRLSVGSVMFEIRFWFEIP
jgi:hypothetical protein